MLKKKNYTYFTTAVLLLSGLWFNMAVGDDEDVVYSKVLWNCTDSGGEKHCAVSFELANKASVPQVREVTVRGLRLSPGKNDADGQTCGQIIFSILLEPREIIEIREQMPVVSMPDKITVSIRE